jgi:hypothetical protein
MGFTDCGVDMASSSGSYDQVEAWLESYNDGTTQAINSHRSTRKRSSTNNSTQGLEQLIKQLAALQKSIEDNTGSWGGTSAGNRSPAQMTSDILSGAAEGAKFGVFGRTGGAIGAGVGAILGGFGIKGANPYINAVTGAASIYETGAKQGVTVQNVISGAAQGATLGSAFGPLGTAIGAGVGGLLDIFGGLFGHHKPAVPADQTYDPAQFNSPSDFDYYAQLYNESGKAQLKYPNLPGQTLNHAANIVQVHFYSDGVEQAVQQQTSSAVTRSAMTVAGAYYDHTRPQ